MHFTEWLNHCFPINYGKKSFICVSIVFNSFHDIIIYRSQEPAFSFFFCLCRNQLLKVKKILHSCVKTNTWPVRKVSLSVIESSGCISSYFCCTVVADYDSIGNLKLRRGLKFTTVLKGYHKYLPNLLHISSFLIIIKEVGVSFFNHKENASWK